MIKKFKKRFKTLFLVSEKTRLVYSDPSFLQTPQPVSSTRHTFSIVIRILRERDKKITLLDHGSSSLEMK